VSDKETKPTMEPPQADRRAGRRSLIAVPMLARWRDDREHKVKVNSRDISDGGVFFHANSNIAIDTEVELTFTLPSDPGATGNKRLRVRGTLIRAEREADRTGYALGVTSSEVSGTEDTLAQARQAARPLAAIDSSPSSPHRVRRARLLFLACSGLVALMVGLGIFIARHEGDPANAAGAIRETVASIRSTQENAPPPDVLPSRVEGKRKVLRTRGVEVTEKKATSGPAEHEAGERSPDASAEQVRPLTIDSTVQPPPVSFANNTVLTLDVQKGKPVSPLGYLGELPSPPAQPVPAGSSASSPAKTEAAAAMPSSTAVVLRAVVGRDGTVENVQRTSGPVELTPAAIAAIRHWKFQPDTSNSGALRRQIYLTVSFTVTTE
jgi:TonB family protein